MIILPSCIFLLSLLSPPYRFSVIVVTSFLSLSPFLFPSLPSFVLQTTGKLALSAYETNSITRPRNKIKWVRTTNQSTKYKTLLDRASSPSVSAGISTTSFPSPSVLESHWLHLNTLTVCVSRLRMITFTSQRNRSYDMKKVLWKTDVLNKRFCDRPEKHFS